MLNEKTRQYSTATNTIVQLRAFHLLNGGSTYDGEALRPIVGRYLISGPLQCLTISVLQAYSDVITAYTIPSDSVRKSTVSLQIKISTAQLNFSNRNVIIF